MDHLNQISPKRHKAHSSTRDPEDKALFFLTDVLLAIHDDFYKEDVQDVRHLLRKTKGVFEERKFYLEKDDPHLCKLILMHGGAVVKHPGESDIVLRDTPSPHRVVQVCSHYGATRDIPIVSTKHIYQSIFKLKYIPIDKYILGTLEHVEDESDLDTIDSIINDLEDELH